MAYGDEQDFGQVSVDTSGGFDPSAGVAGGPEAQPMDSATAASGMADILEQAADDIQNSGMVSNEGAEINTGFDPSASVAGGPESQPSVSLDNLGPQPSLEELSAAIGIDPASLGSGGGVVEGGPESGPQDLIGSQMADEEVVEEEVAPGQEVATFLSDFNQGMAAQSPEQGLVAKIDALQDQAAQLQAQAGVGHPDWGMGAVTPMSAEKAAATASGGGQGWNNPNTFAGQLGMLSAKMDRQERELAGISAVQRGYPQPSLDINDYRVRDPSMITAEQAAVDASGGGQGWVDPDATFEELEAQFSTSPETTLAPQYSEESAGFQTHNQMYPNHRNAAAMAGVASIRAQFDGTHKAWIQAINQDMKDRDIVLDHAINGVRTGKHSSGNWKEYNALFTAGEDGVPRDSNGVAMPGTDKQAQAGLGGVLQGLWGGILSGAEKIFQPSTSSGVVEEPLLETGATTFGADYDRAEPVRSEGDEGRGDHPIDTMRSIYPWARSLPNDVLFNAARYPDYLRLLIEADAAGTELPLVVPQWILDGLENPATTTNTTTGTGTTTGNWITNHPAMQTQQAPAGWGNAPWLT